MTHIVISPDQLSSLAAGRAAAFPARVGAMLARAAPGYGPDGTPGLTPWTERGPEADPPDPHAALARDAIARAEGYGLVSEHDLAFFALREMIRGPEWERRPEAGAALAALTDPKVEGDDRVAEIIRRETIEAAEAAPQDDAVFDGAFIDGEAAR